MTVKTNNISANYTAEGIGRARATECMGPNKRLLVADRNKCAVVAVAEVVTAASGFRYTEDQAFTLLEKHGRVKRKGTERKVTRAALEELTEQGLIGGFRQVGSWGSPYASCEAERKLTLHDLNDPAHQDRIYLVGVSRHIFAYVRGVQHERSFRSQHRRRIQELIEITPAANVRFQSP